MSIRLIRENSDTPNITNRDDARMIRYAYGGQNGYVKGKGTELSHTVNGNVFTINSGVINLQGWEIEIDSNGWNTTLSKVDAARKYCVVYCEVNLLLGGSAKIDMMTALNTFPDVSEGDDLTENSSGTARLVLYQFIAQSGNITEVKKVVNVMLYNTALTTRPPISSISFQNGQIIEEYASFFDKIGERLSGLSITQTLSGARFSYLPIGGNNSVAKVEFSYNGAEILYYVVDSKGDFNCYCNVNQKPTVGTLVNVTANITDIYGNSFSMYWTVRLKG